MRMYRQSMNTVTIDGEERDRHYPSAVGHFMISEFNHQEFSVYWQMIKPELEIDAELVYARVLKYNRTCHIPPHVDSFSSTQKENDISLICQLCDSDQYVGGDMIVSDRKIDLQLGDAVYYTYEHEHGVTPIDSGIRYVLNLRLKQS